MSHKLTLMGAGNIGGELARLIISSSSDEVVLLDVVDGLAEGKSLDLKQAAAAAGKQANITGGSKMSLMKDSDAVVVTAGLPRKPGMSRDDLLEINEKIITDIAKSIKQYAPNAFVIVVTNPLDLMVMTMIAKSELDEKKIVGMAGVLDAARFRLFLADKLGVFPGDVSAMVLGGHGDTMVPVLSCCSISGVPIKTFVDSGHISSHDLNEIISRTRNGGAEIVSLLQRGSAYYTPAAASFEMLRAYFNDERRLMPITCMLRGAYGFDGVCVGVPVILGKNGIEKIVEIPMNVEEKAMFHGSVESVIESSKKLSFIK